jgi:rhamnose utilization protein RhaD (predicted bifunctional aldolase and dehydrogenase)
MQSLWNDQTAAALAHDPLALRVYSSRLLGGDPALVLHGGGNTSVKARVKNFFGDEEEILYVKGSGWDLGTIEAPGFAPVRLNIPLRLADVETLSDTDMVKNLRGAMLDPNAPTPSVETILHAIIPFKFVDHTHADAVVTIMNTPGGEGRIQQIYGTNMLIVPYVMPGFVLARTVYQLTRGIDWHKLDGIMLMNHGVFTFDDAAKRSYEKHIDIVTKAEEYLARHAQVAAAAATATVNLLDLARLRRAVAQARGAATVARLNASPDALAFANTPHIDDVATRGLLTPDHVLRTKRIPVVVTGDSEQDVARYVTDYQAYFERNRGIYADKKLNRLDPAPRWAVWPGQGTVAFGRTLQEAAIIGEINEHTVQAIQRAEALGGWKVLSEPEIFEVEYWELEQAKGRAGGTGPALQGKIAIVSGAASGIGKACVEALTAQGACVTALDINPAIATIFPAKSVLGQVCDVTDSATNSGGGGYGAPLWGVGYCGLQRGHLSGQPDD